MHYRIKDWHTFQHFKDRRPPWIKLYRGLLDDREWHELEPVAAKVLVMLWLIASEAQGELPSLKDLAFRLRMGETELASLIAKLFHWVVNDDTDVISPGYHSDAPERETEEETEKKEADSVSSETAPDLKKEAFDLGLKILGGEKARSLLGQWISKHGDGATLQALMQAQRTSAVDPKSYVAAILNGKAKSNERRNEPVKANARMI